MTAQRRTGATTAHDASTGRRLCSRDADGSAAASAVARAGQAQAWNRASLPTAQGIRRIPPARRMEWRSSGCLRHEAQSTGRVAWHARKAPIHAGSRLADRANRQLVWHAPALGNPRPPATQPRLRAPVATRSEAEDGAGGWMRSGRYMAGSSTLTTGKTRPDPNVPDANVVFIIMLGGITLPSTANRTETACMD